jgi:hypothetical protein
MYYFGGFYEFEGEKTSTIPLTIIDCGAPQGAKRVATRAQANMQQGRGKFLQLEAK